MPIWAFILGLVVGAGGASGWSWFNQSPEVIVGEDFAANETAILAGESDLLRLILLEQIKGMPVDEARGMLTDLGIYSDYVDSETLMVAVLNQRAATIHIETRNGLVVDIHNYCTLYGPECPGQMRDDL